MHTAVPSPERSNSPWRSPWVLAWIGLVVSVLMVNVTFVWLAFATNPGLVDDDFYERGQHYEQTLASRLARDPGWTLHADIPDDLTAGQSGTIVVTLVDKTGQPVAPDQVTFYAYRPSDKSADFSVPMSSIGSGQYLARVVFPLFGVWDGLVAVRQGEDEVTSGRRIEVARP